MAREINSSHSLQKKIRTLLLIFVILYLLSNVILGSSISSKLDTFRCDGSGIHYYSRKPNSLFQFYEVSCEIFVGNGCWRDSFSDNPFSIPLFSFSSPTIKIFNGTNAELSYSFNNEKRIYICYTPEMILSISEPYYCYVYEVNVKVKYFQLSFASLYSLIGCSVLFILSSLLALGITRRKPSINIEHEQLEETKEVNFFELLSLPSVQKDSKFSASDFSSTSILGKCSICKLEIRANQDVLKCVYCQSIFHKEHLISWLETDSQCPVCQMVIILPRK